MSEPKFSDCAVSPSVVLNEPRESVFYSVEPDSLLTDAEYRARRDASDEWNLDNWPPTEEERGIDWSRE